MEPERAPPDSGAGPSLSPGGQRAASKWNRSEGTAPAAAAASPVAPGLDSSAALPAHELSAAPSEAAASLSEAPGPRAALPVGAPAGSPPASGPALSAVQWEKATAKLQAFHAETVRQLFPGYQSGERLAGVVVLPDGRELPVHLRRSNPKSSFVCGKGWAAVRAAAELQPGETFGAFLRARVASAPPRAVGDACCSLQFHL